MPQLKIFIIHPSDRLTDHLPDGDGLIAHGFLRNLANRGHLLYIAARSFNLANPFPDNVKLIELKQRVKIPVLDRIEYTLRARALFNSFNKQVKFDLVQQMNPVFAGLSLGFIGCKVPVILGTIVPRWPNDDADSLVVRYPAFGSVIRWVRNKILALQQRHASALLLTSRASMNKVPAPEQVKAKIFILPHGIDGDFFAPLKEGTPDKYPCSIVFMGRLIKKKGIHVLLEAYRLLLDKIPEVQLLIAGDGPEAEAIRSTARELGPRGKVSFLGGVTRSSARDLIQNATVSCLPSFGEPFGASIIEAMSCGKPVVATSAGGFPDIVPPGGGILVEPGDVHALAAALERILESRALQLQMGRINRRYVESKLTWTAVIDRLESIYSAVLAHQHPAALALSSPETLAAAELVDI